MAFHLSFCSLVINRAASRYQPWLLLFGLLVALPLLPHEALAQQSISGTVFEDVNYGGGAGRSYSTANTSATASGFTSGAIRRPNVRVELYDATGTLATATTTDASGAYTFSNLTGANYTVRVVNATVTSARPGATGTLIGVQTFRTVNGTTAPSRADDVNRVGGEVPASVDTNTGSGVTLAFTGTSGGGDNTLFVDNVQVLSGGTALTTNPITNPDFESGVLTDNGGTYQYTPNGAVGVGWTFNNLSGIQANGSAFTPPNTTSNNRAGFVQSAGGNNGSISQTFNLSPGTYTISFIAANRVNGGQQTIDVTLNGTKIKAGLQAAAGTYATYTTDAFTVSAPGATTLSAVTAQSIAPVTMGTGNVTGVDFGFNFDTVVNTNDSGQGSLRQFVLNANTLGNSSASGSTTINKLQQSGSRLDNTGTKVALPTASYEESSIFMIPNGAATSVPAGLRAGLASGLNANDGATTPTNYWARIALGTTITATSSQYTLIDGTTQTVNVGDSNPGTLGLGGTGGQFSTVGVQATTFNPFNRPEVEVYGDNTLDIVLLAQAPNTTVRGLAVHGGSRNGNGSVQNNGSAGFVVENNYIGLTAYTLGDPIASVANSASNFGILLQGGSLSATVRRNLIGYSSNSGIRIVNGATATASYVTITDNELVQNGFRSSGGDNITVGDGGGTGPVNITNNLVRTANSDGIQFDIGNVAIGTTAAGAGFNTVQGNTFFDNGNGGASVASSQLEGAAILYLQRSGTTTGTNPDVITKNIIFQTQASGVVVGYGQSNVKISQNSTYFNGTPFNSPTGGNLGIDLIPQASYSVGGSASTAVGRADYGNGDGVTPNTGSTTPAFGNAGINYPVFTQATATSATSSTVNVAGYVGNPNITNGTSAFAGATIEIYTADNVPANNSGAVLDGDGQRIAHGEGRTYLTTNPVLLKTDANGYFTGTLTLPANTPPLTGAAITGYLTATAYLSGYGTSEFGPNRPIIVSADVQSTITGNGPINAGATGTFNVKFENLTNNAQADGVIAVVQLPTGLSNVNATGGSYNATTGLVTFTGYAVGSTGSLASGSSFSSTITYTQPLSLPVTATASISTSTSEAGRTSNNTSTATTTTTPLYDLTTAISGPATTAAGNQVEYVVTSTNLGGTAYPSPATAVTQTVSVPAGATNLYVTGGGVISGSSAAGYTVTFTTALAAGQSESQTINFTAPAAGSYTLGAAISGSPADQVTTNNAASAPLTVTANSGGQANVFVHVYPTAASVAQGATGSFIVREGNNGPNAAQGVQTTVVLPPGLSNVVVTDSTGSVVIGGAYNASTGVVTLPALTGSQSTDKSARKRYTIAFTAPANGGTVTATAAVATTSPDQIPTDNTATAQITVPGTTDVQVQLGGPRLATAGEQLTYTLTTTAAGPQAAQNVKQQANLPAGLPITGTTALLINGVAPTSVNTTTGIATYGTGASAITYNQNTGLVTIPPVASIAPGGAATTTFSFAAPTNGSASVGIAAAASNSVTESSLAKNAPSLLTTITPAFDVQVLLSGPAQVEPNSPVLLNVTTRNNGPSTVPNVATTVNIPVNLPVTGTNAVRINNAAPTSTAVNTSCVVGGVNGSIATYADGSTYNTCTGLVTLPNSGVLTANGTAAVTSTIGFVLPTGYKGTLATTATATPLTTNGLGDDALPGNNTATYQPLLQAASGSSGDLSVTLVGPSSAAAGNPVTLTLTTSSTIAATGVLQYVQLPAGLTTGTGTVTVTQGGTTVAATYDNASGLLTLPPLASLGAGSGNALIYSIVLSRTPGTGPLVATASVNGNENDTAPTNNVARLSVPIMSSTGLKTTVSGPATTPAGTTVTYTIASTNTGASATTGTSQTVQVPTNATNVLLNGVTVTPDASGNITVPVPATLQPGIANTVSNVLSFTAPGATGSSFSVTGTLSATGPGTVTTSMSSQPTTVAGAAPLAQDVVNVLQAPQATDAATPLAISPLVAVAQGTATISNYLITSLPLTTQGVLYLSDGTTAVAVGQVLTPTQAAGLRFKPVNGFVGNATFTYEATDSNGVLSNIAHYLIPIAPDMFSASAFTPAKGGKTSYSNGDVLAYVVDANGATYTTAGQLYDSTTGQLVTTTATNPVSNGLAKSGTNAVLATSGPTQNPSNQLPSGVSLNPTTGQLYVSDRANLPAIITLTDYYVNVITTDLYGGTNTVTEHFQLGGYPLPVQLAVFAAKTQAQDALLSWTTASELNNAYFEVERSLDGKTFAKIGQVTGQGTKVSATDYAYTDRSIGQQASGSPVYYRLRQVDLNGTATYSPVRSVSFRTQVGELGLYPNPTRQRTTLDLGSLPEGNYEVTLTNALGETVRHFTQAGGTTQLLDVTDLASGLYQLRAVGTTSTGASLVQLKRLTKE